MNKEEKLDEMTRDGDTQGLIDVGYRQALQKLSGWIEEEKFENSYGYNVVDVDDLIEEIKKLEKKTL